jgi:hypothetical protein
VLQFYFILSKSLPFNFFFFLKGQYNDEYFQQQQNEGMQNFKIHISKVQILAI